MAAYGALASATATGSVAQLDTANLNVTGTDLLLLAGAWEDTSPEYTMTFVWDPAGNNEAMTDLGEVGTGTYIDADVAYLDNPTAANAPARVNYTGGSAPNAVVWAAFFTAAGDFVATDYATSTGSGTSVSTNAPNVATGDMVIDFVIASTGSSPPTYTPGTNQTERLDQADGNYTSCAVSTKDGVNGQTMAQTISSAPGYGWIHWALRIPDAGGGTTYNQSVTGSLTPAGAISKAINRIVTGSTTLTGSFVKDISVTRTGSFTPAGSLPRQTNKSFSGSTTPAGDLQSASVFLAAVAGSITAVGVLVKSTLKALGGSATPAGAISKQTNRTLTASTTATGSIAKQTNKELDGAAQPAGALATAYTTLQSIAGALTGLAGAVAGQIVSSPTIAAGIAKLRGLLGRLHGR